MHVRPAQSGFALIAAAFLILFVGLVGVMFARLIGASANTGADEILSAQAFYAAESGLERGARLLLSPTLSDRVACSGVTGDATVTNKALGGTASGVFTLTGGTADYATTIATLSSPIGATDTVIPFTSAGTAPTYGMAASGRAMIDREEIAYSAIDSTAAVCGTAPCLVGVHRGLSDTTAVAHAAGAPLGQYQCGVTSQGGVPDLTASTSDKRTLNDDVTLQDGWVVGAPASGGNNGWLFLRWNDRNSPNAWSPFTFNAGVGSQQLNGVSMLSYVDGWAVGNRTNGGPNGWNLFRWSAATDSWIRYTPSGIGGGRNLFAVDMVSSVSGFAVGDSVSNKSWNVLQWNGTAWTQEGGNIVTAGNATTLRGVAMNDTNGDGAGDDGWVVGASGTLVHYQGGAWTPYTNLPWWYPAFITFYGVTCVAADNCYAVGTWGLIVHWNGSVWSQENFTGGYSLYGVVCSDASDCWAVGANGEVWSYNATTQTWAQQTSGTTQQLNGVDCITSQDCWAVGAGGTLLHWDGDAPTPAWSLVSSPTTKNLNAISLVGAKERPQGAWREIFP